MIKHLKSAGCYCIQRMYPKLWTLLLYKHAYGYYPNLSNPRDLNEWIIRLMLRSDTSQWTKLADKYAVREYVADCGYEDMLIPLLGVWDNADDIDFNALTPPYVLKNNNGSGTNIFIKNGSEANWDAIRAELARLLKTRFGYDSGEAHYFKIPRKIIAERMLDATKQDFPSSSLIDYKIWCINGEPQILFIIYDRNASHKATKVEIKSTNWQSRNDMFNPTDEFTLGDGRAIPPKCLNILLEAAKRLSNGFPQVRVDFYVVEDRPYFGELAFTSAAGHMNYFTREALIELGQKISAKHQNKTPV